jgi:hypothetical protein
MLITADAANTLLLSEAQSSIAPITSNFPSVNIQHSDSLSTSSDNENGTTPEHSPDNNREHFQYLL